MKLKRIIKPFVKLNIISAIFAFVLLIQFLPGINYYRIHRITNLSLKTLDELMFIFNLSVFIISTIIFFFIMKKYLNRGIVRFLLTILWMPYYICFTKIVNFLLPITYRGDKPNPVTGLLIIGAFIIYPIYIALIVEMSSVDMPTENSNESLL